MEELQKEVAIEGVELVFTALLLYPFQAIGEIAGITIEQSGRLRIKKTLALDEIDKHQAIEHQRGIPFSVSLRSDTVYEIQEGCVFKLETIVEFFGDALNIESPGYAPGYLGHMYFVFFVNGNSQYL